MKDLLEFLAESLADEPEQVSVSTSRRDGGTRLALRVGEGDLGTIIGRQGRTARAIRTVLAAAGRKTGETVVVEIDDGAGRRRGDR
jgi:hypothetical protein